MENEVNLLCPTHRNSSLVSNLLRGVNEVNQQRGTNLLKTKQRMLTISINFSKKDTLLDLKALTRIGIDPTITIRRNIRIIEHTFTIIKMV